MIFLLLACCLFLPSSNVQGSPASTDCTINYGLDVDVTSERCPTDSHLPISVDFDSTGRGCTKLPFNNSWQLVLETRTCGSPPCFRWGVSDRELPCSTLTPHLALHQCGYFNVRTPCGAGTLSPLCYGDVSWLTCSSPTQKSIGLLRWIPWVIGAVLLAVTIVVYQTYRRRNRDGTGNGDGGNDGDGGAANGLMAQQNNDDNNNAFPLASAPLGGGQVVGGIPLQQFPLATDGMQQVIGVPLTSPAILPPGQQLPPGYQPYTVPGGGNNPFIATTLTNSTLTNAFSTFYQPGPSTVIQHSQPPHFQQRPVSLPPPIPPNDNQPPQSPPSGEAHPVESNNNNEAPEVSPAVDPPLQPNNEGSNAPPDSNEQDGNNQSEQEQ